MMQNMYYVWQCVLDKKKWVLPWHFKLATAWPGMGQIWLICWHIVVLETVCVVQTE